MHTCMHRKSCGLVKFFLRDSDGTNADLTTMERSTLPTTCSRVLGSRLEVCGVTIHWLTVSDDKTRKN